MIPWEDRLQNVWNEMLNSLFECTLYITHYMGIPATIFDIFRLSLCEHNIFLFKYVTWFNHLDIWPLISKLTSFHMPTKLDGSEAMFYHHVCHDVCLCKIADNNQWISTKFCAVVKFSGNLGLDPLFGNSDPSWSTVNIVTGGQVEPTIWKQSLKIGYCFLESF